MRSFRISTVVRSNFWPEVASMMEMYGNSSKRQVSDRFILPAKPTIQILPTEAGGVSYAYLPDSHRMDYDCVDEELVRALAAQLRENSYK